MSSSFDIDEIIETLEGGDPLKEESVVQLLMKLMELLYLEGNVLELTSPIVICGDIHGQLYDLFELFDHSGPKENQKFLFMGDYVDRGYYSLETISYLAALKIKYPTQFFLLRGNHECRQINQMYGFYNECQFRYGHSGIWMICNEMFDLLPMAAVIDNKVFSVHGGLSPHIQLIEKISLFDRYKDLPEKGALCDLCWSDPETVKDWRPNQRGAGYLFGENQVKEFCHNNKIDFVTRSHQLVMSGYQWFFQEKLITVWSAPNYMYRSGNKASVMKYHPDEKTADNKDYELVIFEAREESRRKKPDETPQNGYFL